VIIALAGWRNSAWVGSGAYELVSGLFRLQAALPEGLYIAGLTRNGEALTDARNRCQVRSYAVVTQDYRTADLARKHQPSSTGNPRASRGPPSQSCLRACVR